MGVVIPTSDDKIITQTPVTAPHLKSSRQKSSPSTKSTINKIITPSLPFPKNIIEILTYSKFYCHPFTSTVKITTHSPLILLSPLSIQWSRYPPPPHSTITSFTSVVMIPPTHSSTSSFTSVVKIISSPPSSFCCHILHLSGQDNNLPPFLILLSPLSPQWSR